MKYIVSLIVLFITIGNRAYAQKTLSPEQKKIVGAQMVSVVNFMKTTSYSQGISLIDFEKSYGIRDASPNEKLLMEKTYRYLNDQTKDCDIINADNSILYDVAISRKITQGEVGAKFCWTCLLEIVCQIIILLVKP